MTADFDEVNANGGVPATATSRVACVSVDLDSLYQYHRIHGLHEPGDVAAIYQVAVPRLLNILHTLEIPATFFVVAEELERPLVRDVLARVRDAGHELASHSFRHAYDMREWSDRSIAQELERAERAMQRALGVRPRGFRAPGYNIDIRMLRLLTEQGYRYDSSVFPCPAYYAAKAGVMAWMSVRGRESGSSFTSARNLLAPTQPYRPSRFALERRGDRKHSLPLWEFPIGVTPTLRMPLIGTSLLALPGPALERLPAMLVPRLPFLNLELHAIDVMDRHDPMVSPALARLQPDLRRSNAAKQKALTTLLTVLATRYRFATLLRVADELDRREGPPVIGGVDSPYFDIR